MPIDPNLIEQLSRPGGNVLGMARNAQKEQTDIRAQGLNNLLRKEQIDAARYSNSPGVRQSQAQLARMEMEAKRFDAISKMDDAKRKDLERRTERLGAAAAWVKSLPKEMQSTGFDAAMKSITKNEGMDMSGYIGKFDPALNDFFYTSSMTVKDQIAAVNDKMNADSSRISANAAASNASTNRGELDLKRSQDTDMKNLLSNLGEVVPGGDDPINGYDKASLQAAMAGNSGVSAALRHIGDKKFPAPTDRAKKLNELRAQNPDAKDILLRAMAMGTLRERSSPTEYKTETIDTTTGEVVSSKQFDEEYKNPKYYNVDPVEDQTSRTGTIQKANTDGPRVIKSYK